ncbi:hypothetical protein F511_43495 [Dorcoceras hygrometricum]|uniref:Uncharacterized protein n=1 Tax=Dorcoceras hygrometricum TaxID=472368 RepID=A0A2Z7BEX3_9LAMI|nr:hypothetical protein F511_43495 [Dorcoceras hygrometricum]
MEQKLPNSFRVVVRVVDEVIADENSQEKPGAKEAFNGNLTSEGPQNRNLGDNADGLGDTSIDHLYEKVCEMQSSDQSPSRRSFGSEGDESRIDSELRHLVEGEMRELQIMEEDEEMQKPESSDLESDSAYKKEISSGENPDNFSKKASSVLSPKSEFSSVF